MFRGIDIRTFNNNFTCEEDCKNYLFQLKWKNGYSCFRCGGNISGKGHTSFHRRCKSCNYEESITANTPFHKLKIPLMKAFGMLYRMTIPKKGSSCADLASEYNVNSKTAWLFAQKVRRAMVVDGDEGDIQSIKVIDSIVISGGGNDNSGLQQLHVSMTGRGNKQFTSDTTLSVKCILPEVPSKINCELLFGKFVKQNKDIRLWNFKTAFTGSHHRCSLKYLQGYINEFFFRLYYRDQKDLIMHNLLTSLMEVKRPSGVTFESK